MVGWSRNRRCGPIGVDIGSRSIKLVQLNGDRTEIRDAVRWDLPAAGADDPQARAARIVQAIGQAREGRGFRGHDAVLCLNAESLFVQNIRVPQVTDNELEQVISTEAASRLPFDPKQTELRYIEADNVRQGDAVRREVILLACQRPAIAQLLDIAESAALNAVAIEVEPVAMLRCYRTQFRRDGDEQMRAMFVNIGASITTVVIARGDHPMFIKHIDFGGNLLDEAVARSLKMKLADAASLRRHNGDRRADRRDPEITRGVDQAIRPLLDRLATELSMCIRYFSVTFRGQSLSRVVFGGGEASAGLVDAIKERLDCDCELGNPLRVFQQTALPGRIGQWDIATGLAMRSVR
jgi:type IV pilus assembly protein PilM